MTTRTFLLPALVVFMLIFVVVLTYSTPSVTAQDATQSAGDGETLSLKQAGEQIKALQKEVETLKSTIAGLDGKIATLDNKVVKYDESPVRIQVKKKNLLIGLKGGVENIGNVVDVGNLNPNDNWFTLTRR